MKNSYGCALVHCKTGGQLPAEFTGSYHVHLLMRQGEMSFSDGKNVFTSRKDDLVIWQMSNTIQRVECSDDFEADVLLASPGFLQQYNPEMVWASKGFLFIRINPSFHLDEESLRLIDADFELFRLRLGLPDNSFKREVLGRVMQIFLFDLWTVCQHGLSQMETNDNTARLFLRFLSLAQQHARTEREVAFYADKLCITPKYLSEVAKKVSGMSANYWINRYTALDISRRLRDRSLSFTDISDMYGFSSLSHFNRYVKKNLGATPADFRE
jgi:AraC-like DNA-binding protein